MHFTFQSGYIQINILAVHFGNFIFFTFQSGYIQIKAKALYQLSSPLYIPIWLYSNICGFALLAFWLYFTFQSGYIQITIKSESFSKITQLYIPIWLYSNGTRFATILGLNPLYIPIWLYSNGEGVYFALYRILTLHSNLVIFKF